MRKTTNFYILKEIFPVSLIGLMTFTVILLMDKILRLIELIVTRGVSMFQILKLLLFISPSFLVFTIPVGVLLGTLFAFGRLSADSEVTAFKASGMSLYQLFLPAAVFSIASCLLTAFLVLYGLPWGNRGFNATLYLIAQSKADIEIKERVFSDAFDGFVVYVDRIPIQAQKMEGVLIYDERNKEVTSTIFANEAFLINNPESQELTLRLLNGDLHRFETKTNVYQKVRFDSYDLRLELSRALTAMRKKLKDRELSIDVIKRQLKAMERIGKDTTYLKVELHKRYAFPFACIVFGLIGVPMGIQPRRSGKSYGFVFSILILLAYYTTLTASEILALRRMIPPFLAGWSSNLIFGGLGVYLLIKTTRESPFRPVVWLNQTLDRIQLKWKELFGDV